MKCVKIYTLIFHEENNKVLIMIDSFMRKIAYNDFINFYKFLIFCKEKPFSGAHQVKTNQIC